MKPFFRQLGFSGSGQQTPTSFPNSFPASENLTESILQTPTDASDGSQTIILGLPTEADTAVTITPSLAAGPQTVVLGLVTETDIALGLSIALQLGLASETDTALTITPSLAGGITIPLMAHHYSQQREKNVQTLRQSTASQSVKLGPFVDDTDGTTQETGLTIANTDILLSKNGGTLAAKNSGGATHDAGGKYTITLDATDSNTVGRLQLFCKVAGALEVYAEYQVVEEAVYDESLAAGADGVFSADVTQIGGSATLGTAFAEAVSGIAVVAFTTGGSTTTGVATTITPASTVDKQYNGRRLVFADDTATAALQNHEAIILDYVHSTKTFTVTTMPGTPTTSDKAVIV